MGTRLPVIELARAYDLPAKSSSRWILVDRLWPRGISKEHLAVDLWCKTLAPSNELRKWFHAHPGEWDEFQHRYEAELQTHVQSPEWKELLSLATAHPLLFIYASRDTAHNHAVLLREAVLLHLKQSARPSR